MSLPACLLLIYICITVPFVFSSMVQYLYNRYVVDDKEKRAKILKNAILFLFWPIVLITLFFYGLYVLFMRVFEFIRDTLERK